MKKGIVISCAVIILMVFLSSQAMAQAGRIHMGKLKVIPSLSVQGMSDDNIYLGSGNNNTTELEESDWITDVKPGIIFTYDFDGRGSVSAGYQGEFAFYADNNDNDWKSQTGLFALDYEAPGGLIIGIDNTYVDTEDPHGSLNEYKLGVPLTKRWTNDLKTKLGFKFSDSLKILAYYNYYKQNYDDDIADFSQDYDSNEFGVGFQVRLFPKTWGFVRYHYGTQDYFTHTNLITDANDAGLKWSRVNAGLTWDSGAKFSGELNFGYQWNSYDNNTDPSNNIYDDKSTWIAATKVFYNATDNTTLIFNVTKTVRNVGADTNDYSENTGIGFSVTQKLFAKFTLTGNVGYALDEYYLPITNSREDDNYSVGINLNYQVKDWLSAEAGYSYKEKDSNYDTNDYEDNQFMITMTVTY